MNFVAGLLIRHVPTEAEAFALFCALMQDKGYRHLFMPDMLHLKASFDKLERLLPTDVAHKLRASGVHGSHFAPQWFLSCFTNDWPAFFSCAVVDAMLRGDASCEDVLLKVALAILGDLTGAILSAEGFEGVLGAIRTHPKTWGPERLTAILSQALDRAWTEGERRALVLAQASADAASKAHHGQRQATGKERRGGPPPGQTHHHLGVAAFGGAQGAQGAQGAGRGAEGGDTGMRSGSAKFSLFDRGLLDKV